MKQGTKRTLSIILLSAVIAGVVSCGSDGKDDDTSASGDVTTAPGETTDPRYSIKEELPDRDYGGYTVRVLMRPERSDADWKTDMFSDEANGDVINDAVYNRNQTVSEHFGVSFELIESSNSNLETDGAKSILAGEDAYDIIVPHGRAAFQYAEQGLCLDWNEDLPYVDLDKPWWDQDAKNSFEINGKLFAMVGDISYLSLAFTDCMLFNKNLFDKYNEDYLYQKVLDNEWTFDEFSRLAQICSDDLDGNGKLEPDKDLYGYATYIWVGPMQALISGGGRSAATNADGELELTIYNEHAVSIYEDYFRLLDTDCCYLELNRDEGKSILDCKKVFTDGRALLMDGSLKDISYLRNMNDDFGIVPWPKYDASQEKYYTNVDAGTNLFIVPITNSDPERTSIVLEALCAEGYRTVIPAYYEVALQTKYTRDDLSVQMLDIIKEGRVFDIGYYYCCGANFGSTGFILANSSDRNFASFYAQNETSAKTQLEKINDEYGK